MYLFIMYSKHKKSPHQELHITVRILKYLQTVHTTVSVYLLFTCIVPSCIVIRCICLVEISCLVWLYRSIVQVLVCIVHLSKSLFVSFTCPSPCLYRLLVQVLVCIVQLSSIVSSLFHFTCSPLVLHWILSSCKSR